MCYIRNVNSKTGESYGIIELSTTFVNPREGNTSRQGDRAIGRKRPASFIEGVLE